MIERLTMQNTIGPWRGWWTASFSDDYGCGYCCAFRTKEQAEAWIDGQLVERRVREARHSTQKVKHG